MERGTNLVKMGEQEIYVCSKCDPTKTPDVPATELDFPLARVLDMNPRLARLRRLRDEAG